jgi:hypothetical protein
MNILDIAARRAQLRAAIKQQLAARNKWFDMPRLLDELDRLRLEAKLLRS